MEKQNKNTNKKINTKRQLKRALSRIFKQKIIRYNLKKLY